MSEWPMVKLGEYCDVIMGQAPKGIDVNEDLMGLPLIAGAGDFSSTGVEVSKWTEKPTKTCIINDIILSVRATVGTYRFADRDYCLGRGVAALRAKDNLDQKYLSFVIDFYRTKLLSAARGATFLQISKADIETLMIPLPPLGEQKRIAEILGGVSKAIHAVEQQLQLVESVCVNSFERKFNLEMQNGARDASSIADFIESTQYGTSKKAKEDGNIPILRMGNVTYSGKIDMTDLKYIDLDERELEKFSLKNGDLLFNRTNSVELVGKTAVFESIPDQIISYAGYLVRARVNADSNPYYVSGYLNSPSGKAQLRLRAKAIVGMANINAREFLSLEIPAATKEEQEEFAHLFEKCEKIRHLLHRKLSLLQELQKSLATRVFAGLL